MTFWTTHLVAVGLGADAFSVALGVGFGGATLRQTFRLTFHFGLFQALMPAVGWLLGQHAVALVGKYDHWIAFSLLAGIGLKMLYEAFQVDDVSETKKRSDRTRGWSLVMLSVGTSIDALGVGLSMGISNSILLLPCLSIGLVASIMTFLGLRLGERLSQKFGQRLEVVGALILIGIGFKMLSI